MPIATIRTQSMLDDTRSNRKELWNQIRDGNSQALSRLFSISYTWLFKYAYTVTGKKELAEDAVQELFLIIWNKRDSISEARSVKSYLIASIRRIIFCRIEKQKNRKKRNYEYELSISDNSCNTEELWVRFETNKEKKGRLKVALNLLSQRQKEAIQLKFYDGLSTTEISDIMEINRQSVYNHVSKGISKMQDYIDCNQRFAHLN